MLDFCDLRELKPHEKHIGPVLLWFFLQKNVNLKTLIFMGNNLESVYPQLDGDLVEYAICSQNLQIS